MKEKKVSLYRSDMRRLFASWRFYVSLAVGLLFLMRPFFEAYQLWGRMSPIQLLSLPFGASDFTPFAAIFCVLPFADSFCEDADSGFANGIALRVGGRRYAIQRCITVAASGAAAMGAIVLAAILSCVFAAGLPETAESADFMRNTIWARMNVILAFNGALFYAGRLLLAVLFGALWALVGLAISTVLTNRYVTLVAPFVLYQVLWYLLSESPVNPAYLLRGDDQRIPFAFVVIYQSALIGLCAFTAFRGIRRKVMI